MIHQGLWLDNHQMRGFQKGEYKEDDLTGSTYVRNVLLKGRRMRRMRRRTKRRNIRRMVGLMGRLRVSLGYA